MLIRKLAGAALAALSLWVVYGRYQAMAFEVKAGNSWGGVLSDVEYLLPGGGALLAAIGGALAIAGKGGRWLGLVGTLLLAAFVALVAGMSGNMAMADPFLIPAIGMLVAVLVMFFAPSE